VGRVALVDGMGWMEDTIASGMLSSSSVVSESLLPFL
jgi:hypothetical protein